MRACKALVVEIFLMSTPPHFPFKKFQLTEKLQESDNKHSYAFSRFTKH